MASYWRELTDCESDKELVRAGLAYYAGILTGGEPDVVCEASDWTTNNGGWQYALEHRRLWILVEKDDSQATEG